MNKKKSWSSAKTKTLDDVFIQTRDAAAMMLCLKIDPDNTSWLETVSSENHACADMTVARALVNGGAPYEDVPDQVVQDILALTHIPGYEVLAWREAVLTLLIKDFLVSLRSPSSSFCDDAIGRVVRRLGESYRGSTKNAVQSIAGMRTRIRKTLRSFVLALLYEKKYRPTRAVDEMVFDLDKLVEVVRDDDFFLDTFPVDVFGDGEMGLNACGRFVLNEARKFVIALSACMDEIDGIIQRASKNWRIERMSLIDLNIIRIATFELLFLPDPQPSIFINEAVELSKIFGSDKSRNFVNGMLQQICDDNRDRLK